MTKPRLSPPLAASLFLYVGVLFLGGCVVQRAPARLPYPPIPPTVAEVLPPPPASGPPMIWQPGQWLWTGADYRWQSGEYVPRAGHSGVWMPGYWMQTPEGGFAWQPAHWQ